MKKKASYNSLVIGANSEAIFSIDLAHQHGLKVYALDGNPEAAGMAVADQAFPVDINDLDAVFAIIDTLYPVIVVPAPIGHCLTTIGAVNDRYGLPGVSEQAARICTDKYLFHQTLCAAGLRQAGLCLVRKGERVSEEDSAGIFSSIACAPASQNEAAGSAIIKPRDGSGSRGVVTCANADELWHVINGLNDGVFPEDYIIETCVPGEEYGIDGGYVDGEFRLTLLRHKKNTPLPYRQCVGYSSVLPEEAPAFYENCRERMQRAGEVIGLRNCVVHADIIRTAGDDPFIIEMSARPSGHNLSNLFTPMATGTTIVDDFLRLGLGSAKHQQPSDAGAAVDDSLRLRGSADENIQSESDEELFRPRFTKKLLIRYYDLKPGTVCHVPGPDQIAEWQKSGTLLDYHCEIHPGDQLPPVTNGASIMGRGYFILQGRDDAELEARAEDVLGEFVTA